MTAREYFDSLLASERDLARLTLALDAAEEREAFVGAHRPSCVGGGGADRSWRLADAFDRIQRQRRELAEAVCAICDLEDEARGHIDALPFAEWRAAMDMRYVQARDAESIASALGRSPGAVRHLCDRALDWLDLNRRF